MKIVLLESLGVPEEVLNACAKPLTDAGHTFVAYPRDTDPQVQIACAGDADVIMIANMPLRGEVIAACPNLKYIDVAFTGVDHVDLEAARAKGVRVSNAAGYSTEAVAELSLGLMCLRWRPAAAPARPRTAWWGWSFGARRWASWVSEPSASGPPSCAMPSGAGCWAISAM